MNKKGIAQIVVPSLIALLAIFLIASLTVALSQGKLPIKAKAEDQPTRRECSVVVTNPFGGNSKIKEAGCVNTGNRCFGSTPKEAALVGFIDELHLNLESPDNGGESVDFDLAELSVPFPGSPEKTTTKRLAICTKSSSGTIKLVDRNKGLIEARQVTFI